MVLVVTAGLAISVFSLIRGRVQFLELTTIRGNTKELEPVQLPLTVDDKSQPATLEATIVSPVSETPATPIPSQSVEEISSAQEKRTMQLSDIKSGEKTLVTEPEPVTQKSQSATSTPIDKVLSVEPKRIPVSPGATPTDSEAQARKAEQQREELKKQAEQQREKQRRGQGKRKSKGKPF